MLTTRGLITDAQLQVALDAQQQTGESLGATLVTNDVDEFSRVDGLRLENWAAQP